MRSEVRPRKDGGKEEEKPPCRHFDLGLPASGTVRKESFLLFTPRSQVSAAGPGRHPKWERAPVDSPQKARMAPQGTASEAASSPSLGRGVFPALVDTAERQPPRRDP